VVLPVTVTELTVTPDEGEGALGLVSFFPEQATSIAQARLAAIGRHLQDGTFERRVYTSLLMCAHLSKHDATRCLRDCQPSAQPCCLSWSRGYSHT
jgi:hypothetical protein